MAKRKYTRFGETPTKYECTKKNCKWQGTTDEKAYVQKDSITQEHVCPKCMNNEFYGLL